MRGMGEISEFNEPTSWRESYEKSFARSAVEDNLLDDLRAVETAEGFVKLRVDRAPSDMADNCVWSPSSREQLPQTVD